VKAPNHSDNLDSNLASVNQQAVREVVRQLPEDSLSMAWRSSLNERLMAEAQIRKPRWRVSWIAMPAAGVFVACAFAAIVFIHAPTSSDTILTRGPGVSSDALATGLFDAYKQESASREIEGSGPDTSVEVSKPSIVDVASDSFGSEVDSDSL
jgi:hypothetical protein